MFINIFRRINGFTVMYRGHYWPLSFFLFKEVYYVVKKISTT
nr:MAG TPA: hypothetical protein [Caudoviricetes sp.]